MKKTLFIIVCIALSSLAAWAQDYRQAFVEIQQAFEQRFPATLGYLQQYLEDYPYTTYSDEVRLMIGVLKTEKGDYKQASKVLQTVNRKNLSRQTESMWYFYAGYSYIQQEEYKKMSISLICEILVEEEAPEFYMETETAMDIFISERNKRRRKGRQ